VRVTVNCLFIRWQALWQLWLGVAGALLEWRCLAAQPAGTLAEAWGMLLAIGGSALLIALLALLLKPEPLAVCIDYQKVQVSCYQLKLPWRIRLPVSQVHYQLSRQTSHSGASHYLVAVGPQGQAWAIQESAGWPLERLRQLQETLMVAAS